MPQDLIAYSESQDSATLTEIAAVPDPHRTVVGDNITVPKGLGNIGAAKGLGVNATQIEISSPSLQNRVPLNLAPLDVSAEPTSNGAWQDFFGRPIGLDEGEQLSTLMAEDGAGATRATCLIWLVDAALTPIAAGEVLTVRATATTTLVANTWTNGAITLDDRLAVGEWALVGMRAEAAGLIAARAVISGQGPRPGVIGNDAVSDIMPNMFRHGMIGEWGTFVHDEAPTIDFLSVSADTAETLWLDVIKK